MEEFEMEPLYQYVIENIQDVVVEARREREDDFHYVLAGGVWDDRVPEEVWYNILRFVDAEIIESFVTAGFLVEIIDVDESTRDNLEFEHDSTRSFGIDFYDAELQWRRDLFGF